MGGSKNKSPAQKEKLQKRDSDSKDTKKMEKNKPKTAHNTSVITDESQASNYIKNAKVITVSDFAKHMGVKVSTANSYLKKSLKTGTIKKIGGFSGHFIYQPVAA